METNYQTFPTDSEGEFLVYEINYEFFDNQHSVEMNESYLVNKILDEDDEDELHFQTGFARDFDSNGLDRKVDLDDLTGEQIYVVSDDRNDEESIYTRIYVRDERLANKIYNEIDRLIPRNNENYFEEAMGNLDIDFDEHFE